MFEIQDKEGFTLIELLLVVAIVSVLSSLFLFNSTQAKDKAQDAHMASEAHQVELALDMYKEKNGFMPSDTNLVAGKLYTEDKPEYESNLKPLVNDGFIPSIPRSSDGKSYAYGVSTDRKQAIFVANVKSKKGRNNFSSSDNACSFVESKIDIDWSAMDIFKSGNPLFSTFCNPPYQDTYYCLTFGTIQNGRNLLNDLCISDYDENLANFVAGNNEAEVCMNFAESRVDYSWTLFTPGEDTFFFKINGPIPEQICSGEELCICVQ